jgi:hypothetical protein
VVEVTFPAAVAEAAAFRAAEAVGAFLAVAGEASPAVKQGAFLAAEVADTPAEVADMAVEATTVVAATATAPAFTAVTVITVAALIAARATMTNGATGFPVAASDTATVIKRDWLSRGGWPKLWGGPLVRAGPPGPAGRK